MDASRRGLIGIVPTLVEFFLVALSIYPHPGFVRVRKILLEFFRSSKDFGQAEVRAGVRAPAWPILQPAFKLA